MSSDSFDVFVIGSTGGDPGADATLARALATRHKAPIDVVARAIAAKNLRAAQGLGPDQAQSLVKQLQSLGAVTAIRPSQGGTKIAITPTGVASPPSAMFNSPARLALDTRPSAP